MLKKTDITACIVSFNDKELLVNTCKSVLQNTKGCNLKLTVVDNASTDGSAQAVEQIDGVTVIKNTVNTGFGAAHNQMLSRGVGKYHFVINPDILLGSDIISEFVDLMENNPDIVLACPKVMNIDGSEQKLPKRVPTAKYIFLGRLARLGGVFKKIRSEYTMANSELADITEIDFCSGSFFVIRGEVFEKLGGFDERFFLYLEDADLTRRAKQYGKTVFCKNLEVTHIWQRDSAKRIKPLIIHLKSYFKYAKKWRKK